MQLIAHHTGEDQEAAFSGFAPQLIWDIENCANVTEDTYNVTLGGKTASLPLNSTMLI